MRMTSATSLFCIYREAQNVRLNEISPTVRSVDTGELPQVLRITPDCLF